MWFLFSPMLLKGGGLRSQIANGHALYNGSSVRHVEEPPQSYHRPNTTTFGLSAAQYRQQHDLTVLGEVVPDPLQTFDSVGFTDNITSEVRRQCFCLISLFVELWKGHRGVW